MCSSIHGTQQTSSSKSKESQSQTGGNDDPSSSNGALRRRNPSPQESLLNADTSPSNPLIVKFNKLLSARSRTIYIMYFIAFLDLFAVSLFLPLLNAEVRKLGASHFMTGLIGSAYGAIQLISSPLMGRCSDKYGQKPIMVVCLLTSAFAWVIQGVAVTIQFMLLARILSGLFKHTQTLGKSIVAELTPKDKSYVLGNFNAFGSMGFIVGPTIGAHLYERENGFRLICCISAVAFVVNAVLLLLLVPDPSRLATSSKTKLNQQKQEEESQLAPSSWRNLRCADIHTIILLFVRFLFSFATLVFRENLTFVLKAKFQTQVVDAGYLTSLQALMSTVIGFAVGPINAHVYKGNSLYMVLVSGILKTCALFFLFWTTSFRLAATMLIAISSLNPFLRVGVTTVSLEGHQNEIGTILGLGQSATALARMFSPAVAGFTVGRSLEGPFLVAGLAAACGIIATLIAQRFSCREEEEPTKRVKRD